MVNSYTEDSTLNHAGAALDTLKAEAADSDLASDVEASIDLVERVHVALVAEELCPDNVPPWYLGAAMAGDAPTFTAEDAWNILLRWWDGDERSQVLARWVGSFIDVETLKEPVHGLPLLLKTWADLKAGGADTKRWLRLFKATGYVSDGAAAPTENLVIYRGDRFARWRSMSWTTDEDCAHGFAGWLDHPSLGTVFRATVPPRAVLARYDGRGESEVIVNPYLLRGHRSTLLPNVECLGRYDPDAVARWKTGVNSEGIRQQSA